MVTKKQEIDTEKQRELEKSMASTNERLIERITDAEQKIAELRATMAPVERMGQIEIDIGRITSKSEVASEEINNLRKKQESDTEKSLAAAQAAATAAAQAGKPDYKVMTGFGSLTLALLGILTGYVTKGDADVKEALLAEVAEAKSAASSAGSKYAPLAMKIEDLQQKMPSESEWRTAEKEIDEIYQTKKSLLQRVTENEGKIERSLMLIDKTEQSWMAESDNINRNLEVMAGRLNSNETILSSTKAAITGMATEVEAQMRGMNTYVNTEFASIKQKVAMNWHEAHGSPMPANSFYSEQIPARATISIGEVPNGQ